MGGRSVELITQEFLDLAKQAGACEISSYRVGQPITKVQRSHLEWFESKYPDLAQSVAAKLATATPEVVRGVPPLSAFGYGYGDGSGYGYGYGYGDGSGYGYGDGSGSGSGYGYGDGSGYGYGSGYGSGDGDGYGSG